MRLSDVLRDKQSRIVELPSSATAVEAAALMRTEKVGAIIVRDYQGRLLGLVSERDLALAIVTHGAALVRLRLSELMSTHAPTAHPGDTVRDVTRTMTDRRARHVPVIDNERVVGVVSIGDLLKARLAEKTQENAVLLDLARARIPA
jgi:CBS domain-containing protein